MRAAGTSGSKVPGDIIDGSSEQRCMFGRCCYSATPLQNSQVLVVGGETVARNLITVLSSAELYTP